MRWNIGFAPMRRAPAISSLCNKCLMTSRSTRPSILSPGQVEEVAPGVRRLLCNNPSPFTFKGTVSYIVGRGNVAIIDPGPDDADARRGAARRRARRDGDAYLRHPHASRPFAGGAAPSRPRPARRCWRKDRIAPRGRSTSAKRQRLDASDDLDFRARPCARRRRGRERRRLGARGDRDARPHRQSHGVRARRHRHPVFRRSRDGVVDLDRRAAGRRHERLHGFAGQARAPRPSRPTSPVTAAR